jgi:hypothetical protein
MRLLLAFIVSLAATAATAGEFADSGQSLDNQLLELRQAIQELDQRLGAVEGHTHEGTEPPVEPPDPDPPSVVLSVEPGQDPIEQHHMPGRIEAEDFDLCDLGFAPDCQAYFDTTAENKGGAFRDTAVDIKASGDVAGGYQIGWIADGEWLEYTIGVTAGVYNVKVRVSKNSTHARAIDIRLGGQLLGRAEVPNTGSWDSNYVTVTVPCVPINMTGNKILRLEMVGGPLDLNWIEFEGDKPGNQPPCDIVLIDGE